MSDCISLLSYWLRQNWSQLLFCTVQLACLFDKLHQYWQLPCRLQFISLLFLYLVFFFPMSGICLWQAWLSLWSFNWSSGFMVVVSLWMFTKCICDHHRKRKSLVRYPLVCVFVCCEWQTVLRATHYKCVSCNNITHYYLSNASYNNTF